MKTIVKWWKAESATIVGIVLALVNASVIHGTVGKVLGAVLPLIGAGAVRQTVWAPDTAADIMHQAATAVAAQLTPDVTGPTGVVSPAAQAVVDGVVAGVLGD